MLKSQILGLLLMKVKKYVLNCSKDKHCKQNHFNA